MAPFVFLSSLSLLALSASNAAVAADGAPSVALTTDDQPDGADETLEEARRQGEILVVAERIKGQLDVPEKPIETFNEEEIAAYGATSVADLLAALSPQTGSGRGRGAAGGHPVMLLNGQRVSSFREMRNIPPEAIRRVEILPEEVALRFGYPPDQRVVNMILKDKFRATTAEIEYGQPDRGGSVTSQLEASLFAVNGPGRLNLQASREATSLLTEAERSVAQAPASVPSISTDPDPAQARSLIPSSNDATVNATWARGFGERGVDGNLSLNGTVERSNSLSLSGLNTVVLVGPANAASAVRTFGDPLRRDSQTTTVQGGAAYIRPLGSWMLTATVDAGHVLTDTLIDRRANAQALVDAAAAGTLSVTGPLPSVAPAGRDTARSENNSASSLLTMVGRPFHVPAGDATATVKAGYAYTGIGSDDTRSTAGHVSLRRSDFSAGVNLGLPLTSRRENVLSGIGDISLNFSAGIDHLSDFGSLVDWSAGANWALTEKLGLQASYIVNEQAPDLSSLGNPLAVTYNVPVYDFVRGETALVTVTSGGNPALRKERDRDLKLGVNWQIPGTKQANLIVEYFRNNSDDVTASFPVLTPDIEAAFASRVTRDTAGHLVALDRRPVTFANEKQSRLRWGINLGGTIGKATPADRAMAVRMRGEGGGPRFGMAGPGAGRPGGGMGGPPRGGMPMGGMMGRGNGQGRWNLSIYHTVQFTNRVLVAPSGPVLDLLNGDALSGGGVARHSLEMEGGAFYKGVGLRFIGSYTAPTMVNGTTTGANDLRFGALAKLNLRLFVELGQQKWLAKDSPFLKNARFQLKIDNLFDSRQRVTDASGAVPVSYQADVLDPTGRFIGIELRKQF